MGFGTIDCPIFVQRKSIPALQQILNNLFIGLAALLFIIAEIIIAMVRRIISIVKIIIAPVIATIVIAMTIVEQDNIS